MARVTSLTVLLAVAGCASPDEPEVRPMEEVEVTEDTLYVEAYWLWSIDLHQTEDGAVTGEVRVLEVVSRDISGTYGDGAPLCHAVYPFEGQAISDPECPSCLFTSEVTYEVLPHLWEVDQACQERLPYDRMVLEARQVWPKGYALHPDFEHPDWGPLGPSLLQPGRTWEGEEAWKLFTVVDWQKGTERITANWRPRYSEHRFLPP